MLKEIVCGLLALSSCNQEQSAVPENGTMTPKPTVALTKVPTSYPTLPPGTKPLSSKPSSESSKEMRRFTHKMMKNTGENRFSMLGYECSQCTFDQWMAIDPPKGWSKGPAQVTMFSRGELRSTPSFNNVPDAVDFIKEIPGEEYKLIVKTLSGRIIQAGIRGFVVEAQVMRNAIFYYDKGARVHELTSPDGRVFVLIAYGVDPNNPVIPDAKDIADVKPPTGWTYSSRVLEETLILDTPEVATVLAIRRGKSNSTWELRTKK